MKTNNGSSYQTADHECESWLVIVLSRYDDIPLLAVATVAGLDLDRSQVLTEISRGRVDEEALSIRSL